MSTDMNTQAQPAEQRAQNPMQQFRGMLEGSMKAEIAKALPAGIEPDRFIRTTVTAVQMNPALLDADRRSLLAACMKSAQDGLLPDGREAVLNIYNTKVKENGQEFWVQMVQYLPMVRGLLKVARNSGEVAHIDAAAVYERDEFIFERGDESKLIHRPYLGGEDPGPVIAAYCIAKLSNGEIHREVMSRRDIEKVREASKASNGPGWTKWYDQFAIKSVIKRATKLLPSSSDRLERVIQNDNDAMGFDGFNQRGTETTAITTNAPVRQLEAGKSSRLSAIVGAAGLKVGAGEPVQAMTQAEGQARAMSDADGVLHQQQDGAA
jgi:recombination protein RecT